MKKLSHTTILTAFAAVVALVGNQSALAEVVIDNTFANGNGSFEYDGSGNPLVSGNQPGKWVGSATALTIDGSSTISSVAQVSADNEGATDGSLSLVLRSVSLPGGLFGGFLNTGYVVGADDDFTLNFDWTIFNNKLGTSYVDVYVFTSSDDTLGGILTSLAYTELSRGGAMSFETVTLAGNDFNVTGASEGQELWLSFTPGGFTQGASAEKPRVDNISLSVIPEPEMLGLVSVAAFGLLMGRRFFQI